MRARDSQAIMKIKVTVTETSQILKGNDLLHGRNHLRLRHREGPDLSAPAPLLLPERGAGATGGPSPSSTPSPRAAKTFQFEGSHALSAGDNYFWLCVDLNPRARGLNKVDASCTGVAQLEDSSM